MATTLPRWTRWARYPPSPGFPLAKRALDLTLVLLSLPLWMPLLGIVAMLVRVKLGSPVLFRQGRPGLNAEVFEMLKFRSMTDARDPAGNLLSDAERLTPFGRFLRASSLDELPELLCVLSGRMSLVGPRPLLVRYLGLYTPEQARRHHRPPGVTGWAQVNGRNSLTWEEKFQGDVWYVDHASLGLDLWILFRTIWTVFNRDGISAAGAATMPDFQGNSAQGGEGRAEGLKG